MTIGKWTFWAVASALLAMAGTAAAQDAELPKPAPAKDERDTIVLERNVLFDWRGEDEGTLFVHEDIEAVLSLERFEDDDWVETATLTITHPEHGEYSVTANAGLSGYGHVGFYDFDEAGGITVLFDAYTGGAHCCAEVHGVWLGPDGPVEAELGMFDGEGPEPTDVDGDGVFELSVLDQRFNYTFDSYAGSMPPPMILKMREGEVYDATAEPAFRPFIEEEFAWLSEYCGGNEGWHASACAGLAATATLLGTYEQTVAMIATRLFTGEPLDSGWDTFSICVDETCDEMFETGDLLEAIEFALTQWGYLDG